MPRPLIAPSILSADFGRLAEELRAIEVGGADYVHVDVMDGHFVPNLTLGPPVIEWVRKATKLPLDVHLMIEDPDASIPQYAAAGADLISVHAEACTHLHRTLQLIRSLGKRAAVALNPATPLDSIRYVLGDVSMILLMTVNPGFGGQQFIDAVLPKIRELRALAPDLDIEVDGGIKPANIARVAAAGANVFVAGSAVFGQPDYRSVIGALRSGAESAAAAA
ncbi:MAG: ribulose-phosphate 3-epimerase [Deltaproteobacteria bacterium]|nr:ribulose-phosphate 3-epimerase [Deltaproteobacteria bacterium]